MSRGTQNIDSMGLAGKILGNKDLEAAWHCDVESAQGWSGSIRTVPILRFPNPRSRLCVTRSRYFST